jgi:hypothetical protein
MLVPYTNHSDIKRMLIVGEPEFAYAFVYFLSTYLRNRLCHVPILCTGLAHDVEYPCIAVITPNQHTCRPPTLAKPFYVVSVHSTLSQMEVCGDRDWHAEVRLDYTSKLTLDYFTDEELKVLQFFLPEPVRKNLLSDRI